MCRDAGDGPGIDGDPGQFRAPGDGIVKLVLGNGDPPSTIPKDILMHLKTNQVRFAYCI